MGETLEDIVTEEQQQQQKTSDEEYQWPAAMRFDVGPPYKTHHFSKHFYNSSNLNNFLKAVKWYLLTTIITFILLYLII